MQNRKWIGEVLGCLGVIVLLVQGAGADDFHWKFRSQQPKPGAPGEFQPVVVEETWSPGETAIIVCDVWDKHHCLNAVRRLEEFAPRMNEVLKAARGHGATIIHSPSDCMPQYAEHPARKRAIAAPAARETPRDIEFWCSRIPREEQATYPLDQSDGGEDDDPAEHGKWAAELKALGRNPGMPWKTQSPLIEIDADRDYISDRGDEVWNVLESRRIRNVVLVGVHLNMCVLGRPFGLRQMERGGKRVALMRDLTDCMYNPARWPFVDHFSGNDLMVAHVERFVCPTISSNQLLGGQEFRSKYDPRKGREPIVTKPGVRPDWFPLEVAGPRLLIVDWAKDYRGPQWFRCVVRLPKDWLAGNSLQLRLDPSSKTRVWLNGQESTTSEISGLNRLEFQLPRDAIVADDANFLVMKIENPDGIVMLPESPVLVSDRREFVLKGRWQMRLGDDEKWSNIPLPAKFGGATDMFFDVQSGESAESNPKGLEDKAREFVEQLVARDFDKAVADFDATMQKVMPAKTLGETWKAIEAQAGKFQKSRGIRTESTKVKDAEVKTVFVTCEFEKASLDVKVVYTSDGKVTGLFFAPAQVVFAGKQELWLGELNTGGAKLRLLVHLGKTAEGKDQATFDSLDQGQKGIAFDQVKIEKRKVRLEATALKAVFEGTIDEAGQELKGEWRQGGASFPLTLKKVDSAPQSRRPQTPRAPFPYREIEVAYKNVKAGIRLAGTLTVPPGDGPHPVALLITGSGTQDRDETIFEHKPFWVLADFLTRRGIAVLRVDDRGIGGSSKPVEQGTTADFAGDVLAGIDFLKTRPEIDPRRIGLIGHSEGGVIAPLVASQSGDVAFIVLLAGTGVKGEEILYQQGAALLKAAGASEKVLAAQRELQSRMFAIVKSTPDSSAAAEKIQSSVGELIDRLDDETRAGLGNVKATVAAQAQAVTGNWFRYFLSYDPRPNLEQTRCPVLALNGEKDLQVLPKENLPVIREALATGGNKDFEIHELPGLNHLFQTCRTGAVAEYATIEETFAPAALEAIGAWIEKRVK
jgi:pimeloyl-ACP methyl ester carboxylesterase/nicotinamidase-related amidase